MHPSTASRIQLSTGLLCVALVLAVGCGNTSRDTEQILLALRQSSSEDFPEPTIWTDNRLFDPEQVSADTGDRVGQFWSEFRKAHPFGMQAIAVSRTDRAGSCAVVVAEPPPHVSLQDIRAIIPDARVHRQHVMHDGALFDVAGTLAGGQDTINAALGRLTLLLYRTPYRAYYLREPFRRFPRAGQYNLTVRPTSTELQAWLTTPGARFVSLRGGPERTLSEVKSSETSEVYQLVGQPIVVWGIPATLPISDCLAQAQEFALASDLIVGATRDESLLLCGRARTAPYDVLPPLRPETVALLASVQDHDELAQSYQRTHPTAGPYTREYDWAPILLSPELVDTEYGHLLDVADQMLKSWSCNGQVRYKNFDYPDPPSWPFPKSLPDIVLAGGARELTFNWNTTGAAYASRLGSTTVFTPNSTGALPVSYIPGEVAGGTTQNMVASEDTAYRYFASIQNPVLVRVVQYASLYQIFHNLKVTPPKQTAPSSDGPDRAFAAAMSSFWAEVDGMKTQDVEGVIEQYDAMQQRRQDAVSREAAQVRRKQHYAALPRSVQAEIDRDLNRQVQKILDESKSKEADTIRRAFRAWQDLSADARARMKKGSDALIGDNLDPVTISDTRAFLRAVAAVKQVPDQFAAAKPVTARNWIHTPTVVFSNNGRESHRATGGHNVYARVGQITPDEVVPVGQVVVEGGSVRINPKDSSRLGQDVIHNFGRTLKDSGLDPEAAAVRMTRMLASAKAEAPRRPATALRYRTAHDGFRFVAERRRPKSRPARPNGVTDPNVISVVKQDSQYLVLTSHDMGFLQASNLADATELAQMIAMHDRRYRREGYVRFENMDADEAHAALLNTRLKRNAPGHRADLLAAVDNQVARSRGLKSPTAKTHDLANPEITIGQPRQVTGGTEVSVRARLKSRLSTVKDAIVTFVLRFAEGIPQSKITSILRAWEIRVREVLAQADRGEILDVHRLLQRDLEKLREHGVIGFEQRLESEGAERRFVLRWEPAHRA